MYTSNAALGAQTSLRDARAGDLPDVVAIHQVAFRGFFLDLMGPRFLTAYYAAILDYPDSIFLVHFDGAGTIDGFAAGFRDPVAFYAYFRARRFRLATSIVLAIFRRPSLLAQVFRNTARVAEPPCQPKRTVELSSIGTSRIGTGVGAILIKAFCARGVALGAESVVLTTDRDGNDAVVDFYLRNGFAKSGTEMRGGRTLQKMSRDVSGGHSSQSLA